MGRSSQGEVEKSEGQGLVAGGGWVVREKETRGGGDKKKKGKKEGGKEKRYRGDQFQLVKAG